MPKAFLRSWAFTGVDPNWQLLIGPVFATPMALDAAGMRLSDIDVVDIHEAFAAQVLSVLQAFESRSFARDHLGRDEAVGEIDRERMNLYGG